MGVIAISGEAASGKTTIARLLAWKLGYRVVSIGELFRKVAQERGVSLIELHRLAEVDHSIDRMVDSYALEEAKMGNVVIEGHLAAWILKDIADIKVYLKADSYIHLRAHETRHDFACRLLLEKKKSCSCPCRPRPKAPWVLSTCPP